MIVSSLEYLDRHRYLTDIWKRTSNIPRLSCKSTQFSVPVSVQQPEDASDPPSSNVSTVIPNEGSHASVTGDQDNDDIYTLERLIMEVEDDLMGYII